MKRSLFAILFCLSVGCGTSDVYRPLEIEVFGVSARAQQVTLKIFALDKGAKCTGLVKTNILMAEPYLTRTWSRSDDTERNWSIPEIPSESLTLAVYTSSAEDDVLQYVCREITYVSIGEAESGVLNVTLPARMTQ